MRYPWQRRTQGKGAKGVRERKTGSKRVTVRNRARRGIVMLLAVVDRTCHAQEVARCCGCTAFFPYTMHTVRPTTRLMYVCPIHRVTRCPHDSALDLITPVSRKCSAGTLSLRNYRHIKLYDMSIKIDAYT